MALLPILFVIIVFAAVVLYIIFGESIKDKLREMKNDTVKNASVKTEASVQEKPGKKEEKKPETKTVDTPVNVTPARSQKNRKVVKEKKPRPPKGANKSASAKKEVSVKVAPEKKPEVKPQTKAEPVVKKEPVKVAPVAKKAEPVVKKEPVVEKTEPAKVAPVAEVKDEKKQTVKKNGEFSCDTHEVIYIEEKGYAVRKKGGAKVIKYLSTLKEAKEYALGLQERQKQDSAE